MATSIGVLVTLPDVADAQTPPPAGVRVGANYRLGTDAAAARGKDAPSLTVNPANPDHIVEVDEDLINGFCDYRVSFDGGKTWAGDHLRAPAGFETQACSRFDGGDYLHIESTAVKFGTGQNVYATFSWNRPGEGDSILVARSTDGGRSFAPGVVAIAGQFQQLFTSDGIIRPELAVQPRPQGDRLYIAAWGITTVQTGLANQERRTVTTRSDNAGATWTAPVDAQATAEKAREQTEPVVAPNGDVFVAWRTQTAAATEPNFLVVARSTDLGQTWTRVNVRQLAGVRDSMPQLGVNPVTGTLFVVYEDPPAGDRDIQIQRSTDNGVTWSAPLRVNDDASGLEQRVPEVNFAPNGRVDVVWHDRRHAYQAIPVTTPRPRGYGDTYYAYSTNDGVSFSANRRITDRTINIEIGLDADTGSYTWYGPTSVALGNNAILFAWPDSREGNLTTNHQDIYLARADLSAGAVPTEIVPAAQPPAVTASLSRLAYPGGLVARLDVGATRVVIVNDGDVAGALAGSVLARANYAPVLASPSVGLTPEVSAEVKRLEPVGAFVIGDEGALSASVVNDLAAAGVPRGEIVRLAGTSPADTARAIAATFAQLEAGATNPIPKTAVVVDPGSKEAASAGAMAAALRYPVLFAERDSLPGATSAALAALETTDTLVIGGPGTISDSVLRQLPNALRVGGADLYGTARAVAAEAANRGLPTNVAYVVDGERPIDGALASAAVARLGGALVLAPRGDAAVAGPSVDRSVVIRSFNGPGAGYRLVSSDGGVFAFGGAKFLGGLNNTRLARPVVATATNPDGDGYWLVAADGGVFSFGSSAFHGSTGAIKLNRPIVSMAPTPSGKGYFLVASDGGVFAFGDAVFAGSTGAIRLNQPIVSMAVTPTGKGYFLVASDGGVFAFGDAVFRGSTGAIKLNQPIVAAAATPTGRGYLLVASDGGVFAFGDGVFRGSTGAIKLNRPIVAMTTTSTAGGYYLMASDGGVFAFGAAPFFGSTGALKLAQPIVGAGL